MMSKIVQSIFANFKKIDYIQMLLVALTIFLTISISFYPYISTNQKSTTLSLIIFLILILLVTTIITPFIYRFLNTINIRNIDLSKKHKWIAFAIFVIVTLTVLVFFYIAYNPGYWANDNINQYSQALSDSYNDWHPFFHTLIFYKIPILFTGDFTLIVPLQMLTFSLVFGFLLETIYEYTNKIFVIVVFFLIMLNPNVWETLISPMKDTAFGIFALLASLIAFRLYNKDIKKINTLLFTILLALVCVCICFFRHNGILFVIPLIIAMFFIVNNKHWFVMLAVFIVFSILIKIPLANDLHVAEPGNRNIESFSSLIAITGEVAKENPGSLDQDTKSFIFSVAPKKLWKEKYKNGNILTIKYESDFNAKVIESKTPLELFVYTFKSFQADPAVAYNSLFKLLRNVFCIDQESLSRVPWGIYKNNFNIKYTGNATFKSIADNLANFIRSTPLSYVFCCLGVVHLFLALCIFARFKLNNKIDWTKFLLCAPLFVYDLGTALLWACSYTWTTEGRYFFETWLLWPLLIVVCFAVDKIGPDYEINKYFLL